MAKTKALISCAVTAQLICVFVFAYANPWFSHAKVLLSFWNSSFCIGVNLSLFHWGYMSREMRKQTLWFSEQV